MNAPAAAELAELERRVADGVARIRRHVRAGAWPDAIEAARQRQVDIEALCAGLDGATMPHVRALLEAALRDGRAIEPEIARLHTRARQHLQEASLRMHAASQYRVLAPLRPPD